MTLVDIAAALLRTTLATSAAALAAWALLAWLRIDAPRIHRIAWLLVIAQGWLFFPLTIEIETAQPPTTTKRAAGLMPAGITEQSNPLSTDAAWCREPFATRNSPLREAPQSQKAPDTFSLAPIAIASWLLGSIALTAISLCRYLQVLRTLPLGSPPDDPAWQAEWHSARTAAQLRRRHPVDLRITTSLGPLLHWAPWAYLILVPRPLWTTLAAPQRQAILRHELAHLRRGDLWKSLAIRVLALPQWFNPFAWFAIRRFDEAAEWACDDAAAATADGRLMFANSLLQSAEYAAVPFPASAPAARGVLTRRIQRLVSPRFKEESKMKLLFVPMLLMSVAAFHLFRIEVVAAERDIQSQSGEIAVEEVKPRIAPGDTLQIELDNAGQSPDYKLRENDLLIVRARDESTELVGPGYRRIDSLGRLYLGRESLGHVAVAGLTMVEATNIVRDRIRKSARQAEVSLSLMQQLGLKGVKQYAVTANGEIDFRWFGKASVAGMDIEQAEQAITAHLSNYQKEPEVRVRVVDASRWEVGVIIEGGGIDAYVSRIPIPDPDESQATVRMVLQKAVRPDSVDLAVAEIQVLRRGPADELWLPVTWDAESQGPTEQTNHFLEHNDIIVVELPNVEDSHSTDTRSSNNAENRGLTPPSSIPREIMPEKAAELSVKRVGDSLLLVRRSVNEKTSGEPSEDADMNFKIAPRWLESHRRLQPYDTIKLRVARPHRPTHALTWRDVEGQFTVARNGSINFGREQGIALVSGMTVEEARAAIERQLRKTIPDCEVRLELGSLASQKFFVSIQRPDGTEIAAGALPTDSSMPASFQLGGLRSWLGNIGEASWELAEPSASSQDQTYLPGPGDRLVIKVPADFDPLASRPLPPSLNDESADSTRTKKAIARPFWIEVFGDVQVESREFKLPSSQGKELGFVLEPRFLPNLRGPKKAELIKKGALTCE